MKKTLTLLLISLVASLVLSGCGKQEQGIDSQQVVPPQAEQEIQQLEEELDIDKEIFNLDASMDDIRDTGFSESDLSDDDLGI
jgi:peptidoglycan hydrolase CwlO-like protein